eukprot:gene18953-biopygen115068
MPRGYAFLRGRWTPSPRSPPPPSQRKAASRERGNRRAQEVEAGEAFQRMETGAVLEVVAEVPTGRMRDTSLARAHLPPLPPALNTGPISIGTSIAAANGAGSCGHSPDTTGAMRHSHHDGVRIIALPQFVFILSHSGHRMGIAFCGVCGLAAPGAMPTALAATAVASPAVA